MTTTSRPQEPYSDTDPGPGLGAASPPPQEPAEGPSGVSAPSRWWLIAAVAALVILVLVWQPVGRALELALMPAAPQYTAGQLRDRPDVEEVLPLYVAAVATTLRTVDGHLDPQVWAPRTPEDDARFGTDYTMDGAQIVDGHPVLTWEPTDWEREGGVHEDPLLAAAALEALTATLEPYGFVVSESSGMRQVPAGPMFSMVAQDQYGAWLEVSSLRDVTVVAFRSGVHVYAAGTAGCHRNDCHPEVRMPSQEAGAG